MALLELTVWEHSLPLRCRLAMPGLSRHELEIKTRLDTLIKKTRPDFRGHIPAPVPLKTKDSVTQDKKAEASKLAGSRDFRPSMHVREPLGFAATHCAKHGTTPQETAARPLKRTVSVDTRNVYNQVLDEGTRRPLIDSVLSWNTGPQGVPVHRPSLRIFRQKYETSDDQHGDFFDAHNVRAVRQDLEALTPRHRAALVRQIALANPKFTVETKLSRRKEHWDPMSQLLSHAYMPTTDDLTAGHPRNAPRTTGRSGVRIVAAYRNRSASASHRPWH
jgi:hypothetical protein